MKVTPVADKSQIASTTSNETASKARAVAAFKQAATQESPANRNAVAPGNEMVQNQNAISVEELGALRQKDTNVDTVQEPEIALEASETPAEEPAKAATDPALSRQFAILARQEKALRSKQQQLDQAHKAREAQLTAREAELASKSTSIDTSKYIDAARFKADPLSVMAEQGMSYDELVQQVLNQPQIDPRMQALLAKQEAKIAAMEAKMAAAEEGSTKAQEAQYQTAVEQIRTDVKSLVKHDPNFETIRETGSSNEVVDLITKTWDEDKVLLTVEEAAQMVEDHLVEKLTKYSRINKIKAKLNANASPSQKASVAQTSANVPAKQPQPMKTLTNATSSTRPLSAKERAIMAFKGEKF